MEVLQLRISVYEVTSTTYTETRVGTSILTADTPHNVLSTDFYTTITRKNEPDRITVSTVRDTTTSNRRWHLIWLIRVVCCTAEPISTVDPDGTTETHDFSIPDRDSQKSTKRLIYGTKKGLELLIAFGKEVSQDGVTTVVEDVPTCHTEKHVSTERAVTT